MTMYLPEGSLINTLGNKIAMRSFQALENSKNNGKILESKAIMCDSEHNIIVDLGCMKGVIPRIEGALGIDDGSTKDIALISRVNKPVCFRIIGFKDGDKRPIAILSRKSVQLDCKQQYIKNLEPGKVIDAKVTHLATFGCFVDIGCGLSSLLPIDAISVSRISHPRDRFKAGQNIKVIVKLIDQDDRIYLTHKELLGTWEENAQMFSPGETVPGIIRSIEDYGVFVELTPNLAGLAEPCEGLNTGQEASVYIKSLIPDKMKIKLIVVDSFDTQPVVSEIKYFFEGEHMSYFKYSPDSCPKVIETIFE